MNRLARIAYACIALILTACAAPRPANESGTARDGLALAVMDAAGFPWLKDPDHPAASVKPHAASQPLGKGPFNAAIGALVMAFVPRSTLNEGQHSAILAWVPEEQAATAKDAKALLQLRLEAAFSQVLRGTDLKGASYAIKTITDDQGKEIKAVVLHGGPCDPITPCGFMPFGSSNFELAEVTAPAFLGGYRSWATRQPGNPPALKPWTQTGSNPAARFPEVEVYRKTSALLPPWVFIYVAAGSASSCETPPACQLAKRSFVLSMGKAHPY
jgi:hypothetical protein